MRQGVCKFLQVVTKLLQLPESGAQGTVLSPLTSHHQAGRGGRKSLKSRHIEHVQLFP